MKSKLCPLIKKPCIEHDCEFYTHLIGLNPQTGAQEDKWGCAIAYLPILLVENANVSRQGNASMDKVATEIHKIGDIPIRIELPALPQPLQNGLEHKTGG